MTEEGISKKDAEAKIYLFDIDGLLSNKRKGGVPGMAKNFGKDVEPSTNFEECVGKYKPTCLIGEYLVRSRSSSPLHQFRRVR